MRDGLIQVGFNVESSKTKVGKISVPVLFKEYGQVDVKFEADANHPGEKVVLEVEAGRGVTNYQFLKDLFRACVTQDIDFFVVAIRQDYRGNNVYKKVVGFFNERRGSENHIAEKLDVAVPAQTASPCSLSAH